MKLICADQPCGPTGRQLTANLIFASFTANNSPYVHILEIQRKHSKNSKTQVDPLLIH